MSEKTFALKWPHILLIVLAGTTVRAFYGLHAKGWLGAPDQLAWQLTLDVMRDTGFSYASMITYPHEGGSFLVSVFALALKPLSGSLPALSLAGLLLDAAGRFLQIKIADTLFGSSTGVWFGLWTIASVPLLLPWGTVVFALHPLASVFPLVFLFVLSGKNPRLAGPILTGITCAGAISFSFDNIILVPVAVLWFLAHERSATSALKFTTALALGLVPHLLLRTLVDNAFALRHFGLLSIRTVTWKETFAAGNLERFGHALTTILPGSLFLGASELLSPNAAGILALLFCIIGLGCCFVRSGPVRDVTFAAIGILLCFLVSYAISPFFVPLPLRQNYILYRHLSFIAPLLVVMLCRGFTRFSGTQAIGGLWLAICLIFSVSYIQKTAPIETPVYVDAGWVLANKFGERPRTLMSLLDAAPGPNKAQLLKGYGWGLASALFRDRTAADTHQVTELLDLIGQMPSEYREVLLSGVRYAFSGPTPKLDPKFLEQTEKEFKTPR